MSRVGRARQGHLLRAALLLTGDRQRAEDLVQEALATPGPWKQCCSVVGRLDDGPAR